MCAYSAGYKEHFMTTDYNEMTTAILSGNYVNQGSVGMKFRAQAESTVPLYVAFNPTEVVHYYATSQKDMGTVFINEGFVTEGTAAYVYTTQICGSIPLYHAWLVGKDNLYTTNETEWDDAVKNGYTEEGVACYVLPNL